MFVKQNQRQMPYSSYTPRLENTDQEEAKILQLLESYGKEVVDFGGLDKGIAYDRSYIKRRPASQKLKSSPNKVKEYAIIYWQTYG